MTVCPLLQMPLLKRSPCIFAVTDSNSLSVFICRCDCDIMGNSAARVNEQQAESLVGDLWGQADNWVNVQNIARNTSNMLCVLAIVGAM